MLVYGCTVIKTYIVECTPWDLLRPPEPVSPLANEGIGGIGGTSPWPGVATHGPSSPKSSQGWPRFATGFKAKGFPSRGGDATTIDCLLVAGAEFVTGSITWPRPCRYDALARATASGLIGRYCHVGGGGATTGLPACTPVSGASNAFSMAAWSSSGVDGGV